MEGLLVTFISTHSVRVSYDAAAPNPSREYHGRVQHYCAYVPRTRCPNARRSCFDGDNLCGEDGKGSEATGGAGERERKA